MALASITDSIPLLPVIYSAVLGFAAVFVVPWLLLIGLRKIAGCRGVTYLHCFVLILICDILIWLTLGSPADESYGKSSSNLIMTIIYLLMVIAVMSFIVKSFYNVPFGRTMFSWLFAFLGLIAIIFLLILLVAPYFQTTADRDAEQCRANMTAIFEAAKECKRTSGAPPKTLKDLVGVNGLDKDALHCPDGNKQEEESYFLMYPPTPPEKPETTLALCELSPNHGKQYACMTADGAFKLLNKSELKQLLDKPENEAFAREFELARAAAAR